MDLLAFARSMARPALVGRETPHRPRSRTLSRIGGGFLGSPGELAPRLNGALLFPLLSVHVPELAFVPTFLAGFEYWTFFIKADAWEQTVEDGSLVVRRYPRAKGLEPLGELSDEDTWPVWDLTFTEVRDHPSRLTLDSVIAERGERATEEEIRSVLREYRCHGGVKLGGYPLLVQETAFLKTLDPDFQLQFDSCPAYEYADSGIGYVYSDLRAMNWESL
jgi:hypothetical protein